MADVSRDTGEALEFSEVDLHFARLMSRLANDESSALAAAAALASRATGNGDVCVSLADYAGRALPALDTTAPPVDEWTRSLRDSDVVGIPGAFKPLVLDHRGRLYLHRYWNYETRLAEGILARAADADGLDLALLKSGLKSYFPNADDYQQKLAAATAVLRRFCVISGGPGTGKTSTVVKILALICDQARGSTLTIHVAAPTGKAAARVQDAIRVALEGLDVDLFTKASFPKEAFTLHRLLGARPDSVYYRHDRDNPLPLDVLVVDEASMADLALASKLLDALPPRARLILLGDKDQLASVEAGAVLGDICSSSGYSATFAKRLAAVAGVPASKIALNKSADSPLSDSVALLERSYRFGADSGIGRLARRVNLGDGAGALALMQSGEHADIGWRVWTPAGLRADLAASVVDGLRRYFEAVTVREEPARIFDAFNAFRVLCAHRGGIAGVAGLNSMIEEVLDEQDLINARQTWYVGRPVMITRNDHNLKLFNGDVGLTLAGADGKLRVVFTGSGEGVRSFAPSRLPDHETVYAMTVHKAQGSEFRNVLMILPNEISPIMSRELVYTGISRAMARIEIWGDESVFIEAVGRRLVRASALQERLWHHSPTETEKKR